MEPRGTWALLPMFGKNPEGGASLSRGGGRRCTFETLEPRQVFSTTPLITEFMASNGGSVLDGDGNATDWIEIYNPTGSTIDLAGWHLTDDVLNLDKWTFPVHPKSVLDPGEYLVVFASGQATETYVDAGGNLHTDFRLGAAGEYLGLVSPNQEVVHEFSPTFPLQQTDVSYGVFPNDLAAGAFYFALPTPGAANSAAAVSASATFSHGSRVFSGSFQLALSGASGAGQSIRYTLDGSEPTILSPQYVNPLTINGSVQVRARVFETGKAPGPITTANYSRLGADVQTFQSQLPIMLIENFGRGPVPGKDFNQTGQGIHQVARQPSAVSLFDNGMGTASFQTNMLLNTRTGIRERGAFSSTFPEPQYSLESWDESNEDKDVSVFGMSADSDWILYAPNPQYDQTLMNNQFMFELAHGTSLWAPKVQYVEAFLNDDGGDVTMADYVGLYVWTERVKRTEGRLDFAPFAPDGSSGGWLLSINRMDAIPEDDPSAIPQHFHTPGPNGVLQTPPNDFGVGDDIPVQYNAFINFEHPNGYKINPVQRAAIEGWFKQMEDVLYNRTAAAWTDPVNGYAKYIDVENFIDYYILHNLSRNSDGLLLSMWIYNPDPNNGGKLKFGPPWDHDLGSFEGTPTTQLLHRAEQLWYGRLFQDPAFVKRYEDRWHELRQSTLSNASMNQAFDGIVAEIGPLAVQRDGVFNLTNRISAVKNWLATRASAIDLATGGPRTVAFSAAPVPAGASLTIQFTDQSNVFGATSWKWDFGDGATSLERSPLHAYAAAGTYDVKLSVTGSPGIYSRTMSLTVNAPSGNFNGDGVVDGADFLAWQRGFGSANPTLASGDANLNGVVNGADLAIWAAQFGSGIPATPAATIAEDALEHASTAFVVAAMQAEEELSLTATASGELGWLSGRADSPRASANGFATAMLKHRDQALATFSRRLVPDLSSMNVSSRGARLALALERTEKLRSVDLALEDHELTECEQELALRTSADRVKFVRLPRRGSPA